MRAVSPREPRLRSVLPTHRPSRSREPIAVVGSARPSTLAPYVIARRVGAPSNRPPPPRSRRPRTRPAPSHPCASSSSERPPRSSPVGPAIAVVVWRIRPLSFANSAARRFRTLRQRRRWPPALPSWSSRPVTRMGRASRTLAPRRRTHAAPRCPSRRWGWRRSSRWLGPHLRPHHPAPHPRRPQRTRAMLRPSRRAGPARWPRILRPLRPCPPLLRPRSPR